MQADLKLNEPQAQAIELQVPSKDGKGRVLLATIGAESYVAGCRFSYGSERAHLLVGKYTTIADGVTFEIGKGQDTSRIAAYPFFDVVQAKGDIENAERQAYEENRYQIIVGSDVTIGSHAFIEGGIRIGNGAVIRAGAVVREDVPPYAIVEGNPARVTGYRFPQATIDALERIQWWNWPKDNILAQQAKMEDIDAFVKEFERINEMKQPEIADMYDYNANPSMFIGKEKIYESHLFEKEDECRMHVEEVFRRAMED